MENSDDENIAIHGSLPKKVGKTKVSKRKKFVDEVLEGKDDSCFDNFRMDRPVFYKLCELLQGRDLLRDSNHIKIEEQVAIFMYIIGHDRRIREAQEIFGYSGETISRYFNSVLDAIVAVSVDLLESAGLDIPPEVREDPRFYPYFKDCVGAVDAIHCPVTVGTIGLNEQEPFKNKNGSLSQIVLAACSFDLKFHYVLAGWEGSATDLQVLNSALTRRHKLQVPEGKYYLVDKKYANLPGFVAPYHHVSYGLVEIGGKVCPKTSQELFNHRHSLLREAVDRTFEALKARFPILTADCAYPLATQVKLVVAACALHNFIRRETEDDEIFRLYDQEADIQAEDPMLFLESQQPRMVDCDGNDLEIPFESEEVEKSLQVREFIAEEIWSDYIRDFGP